MSGLVVGSPQSWVGESYIGDPDGVSGTAAIVSLSDTASGVATVSVNATVTVGSIAATAAVPTPRLQALRTSGWTRLRIQTDVRLPDVKHRDRNENF